MNEPAVLDFGTLRPVLVDGGLPKLNEQEQVGILPRSLSEHRD